MIDLVRVLGFKNSGLRNVNIVYILRPLIFRGGLWLIMVSDKQ